MSPPVVSIVTIFFNAVRFLEDAVASVLAQTYERWELLLVDDGSTDGSSEIGRTLAARHLDRVRYLEHPDHANRGMSASRNLGIRHGRGDLVALLDADDVWEPEKLTRQVALLEAHSEVDLVYGAPLYWFGWTRDAAAAGRDWSPDLPVPAGTVASPPELALASYPLGSGSAPCPSDLLFRRSLVDRVGGFEEAFHGIYALYEDQAFLAKVQLERTGARVRGALAAISAACELVRLRRKQWRALQDLYADSSSSGCPTTSRLMTCEMFACGWPFGARCAPCVSRQ